MTISLNKGGAVSLTKQAPGLTTVRVGLGWDVNMAGGAAFDLDAVAFLLTGSRRVRGDYDFIFYNNLSSPDGSVRHSGDNTTGAGEGDDETVFVELNRVPADIQAIRIDATIHEAEARGQNFSMIQSAFIRIVNEANGAEIARYSLAAQAGGGTGMVFGELVRGPGEWQFHAVGRAYNGGLLAAAQECGVNVGGAPASPPPAAAPQTPPPAQQAPPASNDASGVNSELFTEDELDDLDF